MAWGSEIIHAQLILNKLCCLLDRSMNITHPSHKVRNSQQLSLRCANTRGQHRLRPLVVANVTAVISSRTGRVSQSPASCRLPSWCGTCVRAQCRSRPNRTASCPGPPGECIWCVQTVRSSSPAKQERASVLCRATCSKPGKGVSRFTADESKSRTNPTQNKRQKSTQFDFHCCHLPPSLLFFFWRSIGSPPTKPPCRKWEWRSVPHLHNLGEDGLLKVVLQCRSREVTFVHSVILILSAKKNVFHIHCTIHT